MTAPTGSIQVTFEYGSQKGIFHVKETKGGRFQWFARGNCGEELTMNLAIQAAKNWILFDVTKKETE